MEAVKSIDLEWDIIKAPLGVGGPLLIYLFFHPCNVFIASFAKKKEKEKQCVKSEKVFEFTFQVEPIKSYQYFINDGKLNLLLSYKSLRIEYMTVVWHGTEDTFCLCDEINLHIYKMLQVALLNVLLLFCIFSLTNVYLPSCISMLCPFFLYLPVIYNS